MVPPKVVLDTNVFLVSISSRSPFHWLFQALRREAFELLLSLPIFLEYEEVVARHMGQKAAAATTAFLRAAPAVRLIVPTFQWRLIEADQDDDKFVDCAIAGQADYLVTEDRHFDALKQLDFPPVRILTLEAFRRVLLTPGTRS